ncbi:exopolysaccharide biosynthesis protein, sugar transferase [Algoriphagus machipongonensis]|uniref:Exopolysaccharide biosynthesis protein, sugar transferase n=1 Tax=Algoriphagus machipongonensis TaxID=388413 RepID=E2RUE2_9BACT|nr:exopolysaccharide biosynthesis protein, sugar transferase [Algoriphagus machipongonensis]
MYLEECLDSVLAQSYSNWECIIVDDHSTDDSWNIIESFSKRNKRFQAYQRPSYLPKGGNVCRKFALSRSKGTHILFLDSDDVLMPFCLAQRIQKIEENQYLDFWAFSTALFQEKVSDAKFLWNIDHEKESDLTRFLRMDALWQTSGAIYERTFLIHLNGLNSSRMFWQDYELHLKALISTENYRKFFDLPPDVFIRDGDKSSLSRSTPFTADIDILKERIEFLEEIINFATENGKDFSPKEFHSIFSFQYFLILQLFLKHGEFSLFKEKWKLYAYQKKISFHAYLKGYYIAAKLKLSNRLKSVTIRPNRKQKIDFPDFLILDKIEIGKHPIKFQS